MAQSWPALAILACPISMGLMMWLMMRGGGRRTDGQTPNAGSAAMQAEIDDLKRQMAERSRREAEAPTASVR